MRAMSRNFRWSGTEFCGLNKRLMFSRAREIAAGFTAMLFQQFRVGNRHAPVHGLAHVV